MPSGGLIDDDYRLEDQVGFLLRQAHQFASEIFQSELGQHQITPTQFSTLIRLEDCGELSQGDLGEMTAMDPATLLGVVQRLAKRDLVAVRSDPGDGRRRLVQLTSEGRSLAGKLRRIGPRVSRRTLEGLSAVEQRDLIRLLGSLGAGRAEQ